MSPPFAAGPMGKRRGPPPFLLQLLRAPLTINNIIAFLITKSVQHHRALALGPPPPPPMHGVHATPFPGPPPFEFGSDNPGPRPGHHPHGPPPPGHAGHGRHGPPHMSPHCAAALTSHLLTFLSVLFVVSTLHNILTVARMHRIRKSVFGESMCSARRRFRRGEMSEEEREACGQKMKEMGKRMPSLWIASGDVVLSIGFLGMWLLTMLVGMRPGAKVGMGFGYLSVGAWVAFILNLMIGVNGLKLWARSKKHQKESAAVVEEAPKYADEKAGLLQN